MCRGIRTYLITRNNSTSTHQITECHHQLLLFVLIIFITIANMCTKSLIKKLILSTDKLLVNTSVAASKRYKRFYWHGKQQIPGG